MLRENRVIVDETPGTTRDSIDTLYLFNQKKYCLIDTAGIRRKAKIKEKHETFSVVSSLRSIDRAHIVLLVIDSNEMVSEQVMRIAGYANDRKKGIIILLNKWDLIEKNKKNIKKAEELIRKKLNFVDFAPILTISAKTKLRIGKIIEIVEKVHYEYSKRIKTSILNSVMETIINRHSPPSKFGRQTKIYFSSQVDCCPPSFVFMTNHPDKTNFSYERYISNQLRQFFGFHGVPFRFTWRKKK